MSDPQCLSGCGSNHLSKSSDRTPAPVASHPTCRARPICSLRDLTAPQSRQLIPNVRPATACLHTVLSGARPLRDRYTSTCRDHSLLAAPGKWRLCYHPGPCRRLDNGRMQVASSVPAIWRFCGQMHDCFLIFGRCHSTELRSGTLAMARATCSYSSVWYSVEDSSSS